MKTIRRQKYLENKGVFVFGSSLSGLCFRVFGRRFRGSSFSQQPPRADWFFLWYFRAIKTSADLSKSHGYAVRLVGFRAISRSHDEVQKSHGKQIHKPMGYNFPQYFHFYIAEVIFEHQYSTNPLAVRHIWFTSWQEWHITTIFRWQKLRKVLVLVSRIPVNLSTTIIVQSLRQKERGAAAQALQNTELISTLNTWFLFILAPINQSTEVFNQILQFFDLHLQVSGGLGVESSASTAISGNAATPRI